MDIRLEKDKKIFRDYIIVSKLEEGDKITLASHMRKFIETGECKEKDPRYVEFIEYLNLQNGGQVFPVAQKGMDSVVAIGDTLLIFENQKAADVRAALGDKTEYTHKHVIKTAEYHTYSVDYPVSDPSLKTFYGGAVTPKGGFTGKLYVRNDNYYDEKYYKGDIYLSNGEQNTHFDRGSVSLEFDITQEQYEIALNKLNADKETFAQSHYPFNFVGIMGDNCADYANSMFKHLGFVDNFSDYYRIDELDDRDMGIFYYQYSHHLEYIPFNLVDVLDHAAAKFWGDSFEGMVHSGLLQLTKLSKWLYNKVNFFGDTELHLKAFKNDCMNIDSDMDVNAKNNFGETPLHIALKYCNFKFAEKLLELGADVDVQDTKGYSPLYILNGLKGSKAKYELLEKFLSLTNSINSQDDGGYHIPLTAAVRANDEHAVDMLIKAGADVGFINVVKDNLMDIALMSKSYDVINILNSYDPTLIFYDNLEHQIPIASIYKLANKYDVLPQIETLWESFDKSLVKSDEELLHMHWE